jgi:hypothetical protein
MTAAFLRRDVARVHLQDCQGGGLGCDARCPDCSTHSLPQVMSAARNLNTVFSTVNTFDEIFSSHASPTFRQTCLAKARDATSGTTKWSANFFVLPIKRFFPVVFSHHALTSAAHVVRRCFADAIPIGCLEPNSGSKLFFGERLIFASHNPFCAEMRKPSRGRESRARDFDAAAHQKKTCPLRAGQGRIESRSGVSARRRRARSRTDPDGSKTWFR